MVPGLGRVFATLSRRAVEMLPEDIPRAARSLAACHWTRDLETCLCLGRSEDVLLGVANVAEPLAVFDLIHHVRQDRCMAEHDVALLLGHSEAIIWDDQVTALEVTPGIGACPAVLGIVGVFMRAHCLIDEEGKPGMASLCSLIEVLQLLSPQFLIAIMQLLVPVWVQSRDPPGDLCMLPCCVLHVCGDFLHMYLAVSRDCGFLHA